MNQIEILKHKIQITKTESEIWKSREWNRNLRNKNENSANKIQKWVTQNVIWDFACQIIILKVRYFCPIGYHGYHWTELFNFENHTLKSKFHSCWREYRFRNFVSAFSILFTWPYDFVRVTFPDLALFWRLMTPGLPVAKKREFTCIQLHIEEYGVFIAL